MYGGVPIVAPGRVSPSLVASSAMPKSAIFTSPLRPSSTFAGFRSRCTVPRAWIASRPRASSSATSAATRHGKRAELRERGAQVDAVDVLLRDVVLAAPADPVVDRDHVLVVHAPPRRAPRARSARPARRSRRAPAAGASAPRAARASRAGRAARRPCRPSRARARSRSSRSCGVPVPTCVRARRVRAASAVGAWAACAGALSTT